MKFYLFILFLTVCLLGWSQPSSFAAGNGLSVGEVAVANTSAFAAQNNPAAMAFANKNLALGITARNAYLIDEAHTFEFSGFTQTSIGAIGLAASSYGDSNFNEQTIGLAIAHKLAQTVSLGLRLDYYSVNAAIAGSERLLYPELGVTAQLSPQLNLAAKVNNPLAQEVEGAFNNQLNAWYALGFSYQPNEKFNTSMQADLVANDELSLGMGASYRGFKNVELMAGARSRPTLFTGGVGVRFSQLSAQLGNSYHNQLGSSPHVVAQYTR